MAINREPAFGVISDKFWIAYYFAEPFEAYKRVMLFRKRYLKDGNLNEKIDQYLNALWDINIDRMWNGKSDLKYSDAYLNSWIKPIITRSSWKFRCKTVTLYKIKNITHKQFTNIVAKHIINLL